MYRIALIDDKSINRKTVRQKLSLCGQVEVVFESGNGKDFLKQMELLQRHELPDVVLMDLDMPVMNGTDAIRLGATLYSNTKFIVLTVFEDTDKIFEAIQAGASGYLLKDDKAVNILEAITQAVEYNGVPMSPVIARKAMELMLSGERPSTQQNAGALGLTARETDILRELASGATYNAIGEKLFISPLTVRKHVANLYDKLHVSTRVQIINLAQKNKLI